MVAQLFGAAQRLVILAQVQQRLDERLWPTAKVKYLMARLVLEPGRPVSEDALIDDFW